MIQAATADLDRLNMVMSALGFDSYEAVTDGEWRAVAFVHRDVASADGRKLSVAATFKSGDDLGKVIGRLVSAAASSIWASSFGKERA